MILIFKLVNLCKAVCCLNACGPHQSVEGLHRRKRLASLEQERITKVNSSCLQTQIGTLTPLSLACSPTCNFGFVNLHNHMSEFLIINLLVCVPTCSLFVSLENTSEYTRSVVKVVTSDFIALKY